jgi:hypothetical protein
LGDFCGAELIVTSLACHEGDNSRPVSKKIKTIKRHVHLPKPYFLQAMAEIKRQTDRGAAIAGTAYLDLLLRETLERHMRPDEALQNELFENRGALQDFSARIKVTFALKLIGSGAYLDLCALRDIRNAFAHSADAFEFEREDLAALCAGLWFPNNIRYENTPPPKKAREFFLRGVEMLADGLLEIQHANRRNWDFIQAGPPWPVPKPPASPEKPRTPSGQGRRAAKKRNPGGATPPPRSSPP